MKFIDFFAGVGGFRRGLELAGHECVGFCEFDKFAVASYTSMHLITDEQREYLATLDLKKRQKEILKEEYRNGEWYADDIRAVRGGDLPRADCWCFGAPCQSFSFAGKRAGLEGESGLVREIFRILGEVEETDKPEWLIYENVKGMLSSNRGFDYLAVLLEMDGHGYDIEWQNINSKWFVPQNRERIYTIGHLRNGRATEIFPIEGTGGENSVSIIAHRAGYRCNTQTFSQNGITEALSTCQGGGREHHVAIPFFADLTAHNGIQETETARCLQGRYQHGFNERKADKSGVAVPIVSNINDSMQIGEKNFNQRNTVNGNGQICRTLIGSRQGSGSGSEPKVAIPVLTPDRANKRQNGRRFKENGEPSFTLTGQDRHGVAVEVKGIRGGLQEHQLTRTDGVSPTLTSAMGMGGGQTPILEMAVSTEEAEHDGIYVQLSEDVTAYAIWYEKYQCYIAIRKLTPKECWRLQGWADDYFEKAAFVNSDSQLYKQSGNGVTVSVIQAIGAKLKENEEAK